jgi:hypothetical protein
MSKENEKQDFDKNVKVEEQFVELKFLNVDCCSSNSSRQRKISNCFQ